MEDKLGRFKDSVRDRLEKFKYENADVNACVEDIVILVQESIDYAGSTLISGKPQNLSHELRDFARTFFSNSRKFVKFAARVFALAVCSRQKRENHYAEMKGDGAIAQHGSTAVASQGLNVGGSSTNSVLNTGTLNLFYNYYLSPSGKACLSGDEFGKILRDYLAWVIKDNDDSFLWGIIPQSYRCLSDVFVPLSFRRFSHLAQIESVNLDRVFIDALRAREPETRLYNAFNHRAYAETIEITEILSARNRLAIIGNPGSGKSTLSAYLAMTLAKAAFEGSKPDIKLPQNRSHLLPLLIPLRYFREYEKICATTPEVKLKEPRTGTLAGFIPWYFEKHNPVCKFSQDFFDRMLLGGGCLLILDGLDEILSNDLRSQMREQVNEIGNIYRDNVIMITARECGYREQSVISDDFDWLEVQDLSDEQIELLVHNWCRQLFPDSIDIRVREITTEIDRINGLKKASELQRLVNTPLMTAIVMNIKKAGRQLPRQRVELYETAIEVILQAQYLPEDSAKKEVVDWGGSTWRERRNWLSYLALEMHRGGDTYLAISEQDVRKILSEQIEIDNSRLDTFIQAIRLRGGLFEERAGKFQFSHLVFQEFLAAFRLAKKRDFELFDQLTNHFNDTWWREVFILVYGYAKTEDNYFAADYIKWLYGKPSQSVKRNAAKDLAGLELSAATFLEMELPDLDIYNRLAGDILRRLMVSSQDISANLRFVAGNTLSVLGDPRFDRKHWCLTKGTTWGFQLIPKGNFIMGDDSYDEQKPQGELDFPYSYWLARYPVTVEQFRSFVSDAKYDFDFGQNNINPMHPVVDITWYDAFQYCVWLNDRLKEMAKECFVKNRLTNERRTFYDGLLNGHLHVSLPNEEEWEKAARGIGGFIYPWGFDEDCGRANYEDTGIGTTNAVGIFPDGQSPFGIMDMSGNVCEWTRSFWKPNYNSSSTPFQKENTESLNAPRDALRVLRGGSFFNAYGGRCTFRYRDYPDKRIRYYGFRLVITPKLG